MPSPFPGMDPFIEMLGWTDFHTNLAVEIQRRLNSLIVPRYVARVQERVYIETQYPESTIIPDVSVARMPHETPSPKPAAVAELEPATYMAALPDEHFEPYLEVRDRASNEVVTIIEILSPTNKRRGSDGFREYRDKWLQVLRSPAHLVEIDLLRAGERPATTQPLRPTTDYCVMIYRRDKRPVIDVFEWPLRHPLPSIPIPLAIGDPDAWIDLQTIVKAVYDGAGYEYMLPYERPLSPPPRQEDLTWIEQTIAHLARKS